MPKTAKTPARGRSAISSRLAIDIPTPAMLAPSAVAIADAGLTKKRREFARHVADGANGAEAYRKATGSKGKPHTVANEAWKLMKNPEVLRTIEALKRAKELADSLSAAQIRALILNDLVKHSQDESLKASDRLQALRLLGQLSDVQAYTERKETISIKASVDIKEQILEKLKFIGAHSTEPKADSHKPPESSGTADDADSLLNELRNDPNVIEGELIEQGEDFPLIADSDKPESNSGLDDAS